MRATWPLLGSNGPYSRVPLAAFLEAEVRLGLDGVDFVPQTPHFWCSHTGHESAAPLRAALAEAGLPVRVLTPPPYRYSLTAPPGRQREATLDYYRVCIALAAELQRRPLTRAETEGGFPLGIHLLSYVLRNVSSRSALWWREVSTIVQGKSNFR